MYLKKIRLKKRKRKTFTRKKNKLRKFKNIRKKSFKKTKKSHKIGGFPNPDYYKNLTLGVSKKTINASKNGEFESTYGEIKKCGIPKILSKVSKLGDGLNFYDLGCGQGKVLEEVYNHGNFSKIVGVELCPNRVSEAKLRVNNLKNTYVIEDNLLNKKYLEDADVIFLSNLCFNYKMQEKLEKLINERKNKNKLKIFASKKLNINFSNYEKMNVPMTWNDGHTMNIYEIN